MHPRQMRETSRPVRPSLVYSILALLHPALPFRGEGSAARAGMGEAGVIGGSLYSPLEAISRGTEGSNPSPSSEESVANLTFGGQGRRLVARVPDNRTCQSRFRPTPSCDGSGLVS